MRSGRREHFRVYAVARERGREGDNRAGAESLRRELAGFEVVMTDFFERKRGKGVRG